jgi:hypothetical protein
MCFRNRFFQRQNRNATSRAALQLQICVMVIAPMAAPGFLMGIVSIVLASVTLATLFGTFAGAYLKRRTPLLLFALLTCILLAALIYESVLLCLDIAHKHPAKSFTVENMPDGAAIFAIGVTIASLPLLFLDILLSFRLRFKLGKSELVRRLQLANETIRQRLVANETVESDGGVGVHRRHHMSKRERRRAKKAAPPSHNQQIGALRRIATEDREFWRAAIFDKDVHPSSLPSCFVDGTGGDRCGPEIVVSSSGSEDDEEAALIL